MNIHNPDASQLRYVTDFSQENRERYEKVLALLAREVGLYEVHHVGIWAGEPYPGSVKMPSGIWVGPVVDGIETLCDPKDTPALLAQREPHFCFAVERIEPHLEGRRVTTSPFVGPLGWAAFVDIDGKSVEFLIPDPAPWQEQQRG